jgi:hypothetical protein
MTTRVLPSYYSPTGFQKLTVSSSAVGFTLPSAPQTRAVIFTVENNPIRMKVDTGTVSATDGLLLYVGDEVELTNVEMINNCRLIAQSSDGLVQIQYFGGGV